MKDSKKGLRVRENKKSIQPLNFFELEDLARELSIWTAAGGDLAQLQKVELTENGLGLGFFLSGQWSWLWVDLTPLSPQLIRLDRARPRQKKVVRPLALFIKAHFLGKFLTNVGVHRDQGRILRLSFAENISNQSESEALNHEIELRLFPHGQNAIAHVGSKFVAFAKPKELGPILVPNLVEAETRRTWNEIEDQWRNLYLADFASEAKDRKNKTSDVHSNGTTSGDSMAKVQTKVVSPEEKAWNKTLKKKELALKKMEEEILEKTSSIYSDLGQWLKENQTLDVPEQWSSLVNREQPLFWNVDRCFQKAKDNARKIEGTRARWRQVKNELEEMKKLGPPTQGRRSVSSVESQRGVENSKANLLQKANARGRRFALGDKGSELDVYIGKSAGDNLALLRRAQPFDYWLHLRDYPGSHAILRRARGRKVSDAELTQAGVWVIEQSLAQRAHELKGMKFDLLIVECRYVRPIKGDRLGRVTYSNDRVMTIRL